jgi:DNA-binding transcriptional LysR family regulator
VLPTLATTWLIPRLPDFAQSHGGVAINLSVRTLPFRFNDHPFDAAIYHATEVWPHTVGIKLFDEQALVPVCNGAVLAQLHGQPGGLAAVTHLHMASRPDAWRAWYREQGLEYLPSISAGPRYELFTMTLAALRAGLGVALMPRLFVQDALASGDLHVPFGASLAVSEAYFFSYPDNVEPSAALLAFESWLQEAAGTHNGPLHSAVSRSRA